MNTISKENSKLYIKEILLHALFLINLNKFEQFEMNWDELGTVETSWDNLGKLRQFGNTLGSRFMRFDLCGSPFMRYLELVHILALRSNFLTLCGFWSKS